MPSTRFIIPMLVVGMLVFVLLIGAMSCAGSGHGGYYYPTTHHAIHIKIKIRRHR